MPSVITFTSSFGDISSKNYAYAPPDGGGGGGGAFAPVSNGCGRDCLVPIRVGLSYFSVKTVSID